MFTSNGFNPSPQYYIASSSTFNLPHQYDSDKNINLLHQNHPADSTLSSSPFFFHNYNQTHETETNLINLQSSVSNAMNKQDIICSFSTANHDDTYLEEKPTKKDRHSKIYTAHGLRDRRVRLSIEIARDFFNLQDMLGFDKASKTVEWLLNKSKKDITLLANTKLGGDNINSRAAKSLSISSTNSDSFGGVLEMTAKDHNDDLEGLVLVSKSKSLMGVSKDESIMKDSRAKARARARERTIEKIMCTKRTSLQYSYSSKNCPCSPHILNQFRALNYHQQHEDCPRGTSDMNGVDQPRENTLFQRKLKPTASSSIRNSLT